jgi:hypothetical protein
MSPPRAHAVVDGPAQEPAKTSWKAAGRRGRGAGEGPVLRRGREGREEIWGFLRLVRAGTSGASVRGPTGGTFEAFCGMDSTKLGCEARFQLYNPAWLRGLICMRWAVLR